MIRLRIAAGDRTGGDGMKNRIESEVQGMVVIDIVIQSFLDIPVFDRRDQSTLHSGGIYMYIIPVVAVYHRSIGEQLRIEDMIPPEGRRRISPVNTHDIAQPQNIVAIITRQIDPVLL